VRIGLPWGREPEEPQELPEGVKGNLWISAGLSKVQESTLGVLEETALLILWARD